MKKNEYLLLVQLWDSQQGKFYWADNESDPREAHERIEALQQEGWQTLSTFPCGSASTQRNYLLQRAVVESFN